MREERGAERFLLLLSLLTPVDQFANPVSDYKAVDCSP